MSTEDNGVTEKTPLVPVPENTPLTNQDVGMLADGSSVLTKSYDELHRDAQINVLADLYIKCTRQHRMHRLSHEYFHKRDAAFNFFPLLILTMLSAILSFLATVDIIEATVKEIFSISVSIFAIFSVAVQSYAKYTNFAAKFEMHRSAAIGMLKLGDRVQVLFSDPDLRVPDGVVPDGNVPGDDVPGGVNIVTNNPTNVEPLGNGDGNQSVVSAAGSKRSVAGDLAGTKNLSIEDKISIHQLLYDQVIDSIDSTFPRAVTEAFGIMDARLNISFRTKFTQHQYGKDLEIEPDLVVWLSERLIKIAAYNELYTELANSRGWPWCATEPHKAVDRALARVHRTYVESSRSFLAVDVHMDETIWTLCTWAFCCCFDPTSWFWSSCVEARRKQRKAQKRDYVEV